MGIRVIRPMTNGQRDMSYLDGKELTTKKPRVPSLLRSGKKVTGRSRGTISIRHRGGGTRSKYRVVDFSGKDKLGIWGKVTEIEYDPSRTAYIALVNFEDGDKRYVLAWKGIRVGNRVITDLKTKPKKGYRMQLKNIPEGFSMFNIEIKKNRGGRVARAAGQSAKLVSVQKDYVQIQFSSGEIRLVRGDCFATIGEVCNEEHSLVRIGKAGRVRHMGRRPQVRGKAMNPNDHPHGGGEAGNSIGMKYPKTPWGAHALGVKTRKTKASSKFIVRSRHRAQK